MKVVKTDAIQKGSVALELNYMKPKRRVSRGLLVWLSCACVTLPATAILLLSVYAYVIPVSQRERLPALLFGGFALLLLIVEFCAMVLKSRAAALLMAFILLVIAIPVIGNLTTPATPGQKVFGAILTVCIGVISGGHFYWWRRLLASAECGMPTD